MAILSHLRRGGQHLAEAVCIDDKVIGGQHRHNRFGVLPQQVNGTQPDGGASATALRLDDKVLPRQLGRLSRQRIDVLGTGDDENLLGLENGRDPIHGMFEHRTPADERE